MENTNYDDLRYQEAIKRIKKIKGFYTHLAVYVVINIMIIIVNIQSLDANETYLQKENFFTAFFWGIGLAAHASSTFLPNWFLGKDWEQKKIKEFMEKEKNNKWE